MVEGINEKCAVAGFITNDPVTNAGAYVYQGLQMLQHRGPEASGIASQMPTGTLNFHRGFGSVIDVFRDVSMAELHGRVAIGHNRYSTNGSKGKHLQPVLDVQSQVALAHNGNIPTTVQLEAYLAKCGINPNPMNDSEMAGYALGQLIKEKKTLPEAVKALYPLLTGAFSCVAMHNGTLLAFRDPCGIRPLAIGQFDSGYAIASETRALKTMHDAEYLRDVRPGELVVFAPDKPMESYQIVKGQEKLDIFELVYFAMPDSMLYGQRVKQFRLKSGMQLAKEHPLKEYDDTNLLVVPVPDTSKPVAVGYAEARGLRYLEAILKYPYAGRTFLQTTQKARIAKVLQKYSVDPDDVRGKDLILIDDSIVRLNTMPTLVRMVREAGARSVLVLIASPPVRFADYYGINTPMQSQLAAANMPVASMQQEIGCDYLGYLSLEGMLDASGKSADKFNLSCFTGDYPIDIGENMQTIRRPISMSGIAEKYWPSYLRDLPRIKVAPTKKPKFSARTSVQDQSLATPIA